VGYRYRMWQWRRHWLKWEMAQWPKPPTDYQLQRFWKGVMQETRAERRYLESHI
jgi:hypothetical protein